MTRALHVACWVLVCERRLHTIQAKFSTATSGRTRTKAQSGLSEIGRRAATRKPPWRSSGPVAIYIELQLPLRPRCSQFGTVVHLPMSAATAPSAQLQSTVERCRRGKAYRCAAPIIRSGAHHSRSHSGGTRGIAPGRASPQGFRRRGLAHASEPIGHRPCPEERATRVLAGHHPHGHHWAAVGHRRSTAGLRPRSLPV